MNSLKAFSVFIAGFLFLAGVSILWAQQKDGIQEAQVLAVLKSLDAAILKKNAKNASANFAEDAVITIVLFERGEKYTETYNKKQYEATLEAAFDNFTDYTAERSDTRVRIASDGKSATVKSIFVETFRRDGIKMKCVTEESYTLGLSAGNIVISTMSNLARMQ